MGRALRATGLVLAAADAVILGKPAAPRLRLPCPAIPSGCSRPNNDRSPPDWITVFSFKYRCVSLGFGGMVIATQLPMRFTFYPVLACFLGSLLSGGCGKPADVSSNQPTVATNAAPAPQEAGPGPGEKVCFACKGEGTVPCLVPGCVNGQVDCPGPCLKLSRGTWTHMVVAGHPPTDLWITFTTADGGTMSWNQNHVGDVIAYQT